MSLYSDRVERRDTSSSFAQAMGLSLMPTASGAIVNARMSENLATVTACVNAISSGLASLPAFVYQQTDAGRIEAPTHPVARLVRQPNVHQTWPDWLEWKTAQALLHGNALSVLQYDGAGRITGLLPIPWMNCSVQMLPSGRLAYDVVAYQSPWGTTGMPRRYLEGDVLHLRDRSDDGLIGRSRISRAPDVLGNAQSLQAFAGHAWQNQGSPSGAVEVEHSMTKPNFERLQSQIRENVTGTTNARKVLLLDNKATWKSISVSPENAEVLASRRFSVEELCRLFNVPPPIVADYTHNTFTNSSQADLWFASRTLLPWAKKIEAEFKRSVFGPSSPFELEIDLSGLMRGDYATRWTAYGIARDKDILTVDEIREAEGYGPRASVAAP